MDEEAVKCEVCGLGILVEEVEGGGYRCIAHRTQCAATSCVTEIIVSDTFCSEHNEWFVCSTCDRAQSHYYYCSNGECDDCQRDNDDDENPSWMGGNPRTLKFVGDDGTSNDEPVGETIYLGVELELECTDSFSDVSGGNFDYLWHKSDGSLDKGVETVSHPATLGAHRKYVQWKDFLRQNRSSLTPESTCGMHIHIGRNALEYGVVDKFILFVYSHEEFINMICRRPPGSYRVKEQGGPSKHDRYQIINITCENTIEFRQPNSTDNLSVLLAMIEFCHASVMFTKGLTLSAVRRPDAVARFIDYVSAKDYPELTRFLNKKGHYERFDASVACG